MAIRKLHELGSKATHYIASGASSVAGVIVPAGVERAIGTVSSAYLKDPNDPAWAADAGMAQYRRFMARWLADADTTDIYYTYGYTVGLGLMQILRQCEGEFSRERIMREAANLRGLELPTLLPGIRVDTFADRLPAAAAAPAHPLGWPHVAALRAGDRGLDLVARPRPGQGRISDPG